MDRADWIFVARTSMKFCVRLLKFKNIKRAPFESFDWTKGA
jgi:hypothetical protein